MLPVNKHRFAHGDGFTGLCVRPSNSTTTAFDDSYITYGTDGAVCLWTLEGKENEPRSFFLDTNYITAACATVDRLYVATDKNRIETLRLPDGEHTEFVVGQSSLGITDMCINKSGTHILFCSRDFKVKWVRISDNHYCKIFDEHTAPVHTVALDPLEEFCASSSGDGFIRIWSLEDSAQESCAKSLPILEKCNDFQLNRPFGRVSWEPSGTFLAVPTRNEVQLYERNIWTVSNRFTADEGEVLSICVYAHCGKYIAAGSMKGTVYVWNVADGKCIAREKVQPDREVPFCHLLFQRGDSSSLVYTDVQGYIGRMSIGEVVNRERERTESPLVRHRVGRSVFLDDEASVDHGDHRIESANDRDDDDEDVRPMPQSHNTRRLRLADDDEATRDSDIGAIKASYNFDTEPFDPALPAPVILAPPVPSWEPTPLQAAFMSASTPAKLSERIMRWNNVGLIRQYSSEHEQSIDVEFHDATVHHPIHISNAVAQYSIADVNSEAVVLASRLGAVEEGAPSQITVMHFGSWDSAREWSVPMLKKEDILTVCLGRGWLAVGVDKRVVRLWTLAGTQRFVFSLPGPLITMAAHDDLLAVAYHAAMGISGEQSLAVAVYHVRTDFTFKSLVPLQPHMPMALSAKSTLAWLGFSEEGTLCSTDSKGVVRVVQRFFNSSWLPICYLKHEVKSKNDRMWVIGVTENPPQIRCVLCKNSKHPSVVPRPSVSIVAWALPLCEPTTEKTQLEATLYHTTLREQHRYRTRNLSVQTDALGVDMRKAELDCVLKLFVLACKSDKDARALDVAALMPTAEAVQVLINYASKLRRKVLAEKLAELAREKLNIEQEESRQTLFGTGDHCSDEQGRHTHSYPTNGYAVTETEHRSSVSPALFEHDENLVEVMDTLDNPLLKTKERTLRLSLGKRNPFKRTSEGRLPDAVVETSCLKGSKAFDAMPALDVLTRKSGPSTSGAGAKRKQNAQDSDAHTKSSASRKQAKLVLTTSTAPTTLNPTPDLFANDSVSQSPSSSSVEPACSVGHHGVVISTNPAGERSTTKQTGFSLWLQCNRVQLRESLGQFDEDDMNTGSAEFTKFAAKKFRELDAVERTAWNQKAVAASEPAHDVSSRDLSSKLAAFAYAS